MLCFNRDGGVHCSELLTPTAVIIAQNVFLADAKFMFLAILAGYIRPTKDNVMALLPK